MYIRIHSLFHKKHFHLGLSQEWKFDISAVSEKEAYKRFKTSLEGLADADARRRLFQYGKNEAVKREKSKLFHEIYSNLQIR